MLRVALAFLVVALVAAFFGFGGVATGAAMIAKFMFFGFLVFSLIAFVVGLVRR